MKTRSLRLHANMRRHQGGWVALPYILEAASVAAAGYGAYQSHEAGVAAANQAQAQARAEGDSAKQQQIDRRRQLLSALASQNASAAAGGIETSGSVAAGARRDIRDNTNDLLVVNANTQARQQALQAQASNAMATGNARAASSLLDAAVGTYRGMK